MTNLSEICIKELMFTCRQLAIMPENFVQCALGTHLIQIDMNRFNVEQNDGFIIVTARDNSGLRAIISIENIPRGQDHNEIWHDTFSSDPLGALHQMVNNPTSLPPLTSVNTNLVINGHNGFDVFSHTSTMAAYRICYWLENDNAIDIFAASTELFRIKEEIAALATTILVT